MLARPHRRLAIVVLALFCSARTAAVAVGDPVLEWNAIAVATPNGSPFNQARVLATVHLAVFEAVNAIIGGHEPYLGTVVAPPGASVDAAVVTAAHGVLKFYAPPASAATLDAQRAASLAAIPAGGNAKASGIAVGEAAAAAMIAARANDGADLPEFHVPPSTDAGEWQTTPTCPAAGGSLLHWQNVTPFVLDDPVRFHSTPPPALTSRSYSKDYDEVKRVGRVDSPARPQHRTDIARFYASSSPGYIMNLVARQLAVAEGRSTADNARVFALLNMAMSDAAVAAFGTKYYYRLWRPETAIRSGDVDGNDRTDGDLAWAPLIPAPCFPSYPSNHASLSGAGAEVIRREFGAAGHTLIVSNPNSVVPTLQLPYRQLKQLVADIDDARVYGGIHFRFDQEAGSDLGRQVATYVVKHALRRSGPN